MGSIGELGCFRGVKVLMVGDMMLDKYENGPAHRLSPEAPVPVVLNPDESSQPGGLGNVACNTLSLGGSSVLVGVVGVDSDGEALVKMLSDAGACTDYIVPIVARRTTTKNRIMTGSHHHCRVDKEDSYDITGEDAERIIDAIRRAIADQKPDVLYFADYDKGVLEPDIVQAAITAAQQAEVFTIADPKLKHPWAFKTVDIYKPNMKRFGQILEEEILTESELQEAVNDFQPHMAVGHVLVTRGPHGMSLYKETELVKHIPARLVEVSELSGAGDTVGAVLSLGIGGGLSVQRSAEIANVAASLVVSKVGTATCTPFELAEALELP
jgi:D-beta-D-heptose 7-phosphate kinase/D-beta-D-heptose 1-phosphate adenosyltransferase